MTKKILTARDIDQIARDPERLVEQYRREGYHVPDLDWSKHVDLVDPLKKLNRRDLKVIAGDAAQAAEYRRRGYDVPDGIETGVKWPEHAEYLSDETWGQRVSTRRIAAWVGVGIAVFVAGALIALAVL